MFIADFAPVRFVPLDIFTAQARLDDAIVRVDAVSSRFELIARAVNGNPMDNAGPIVDDQYSLACERVEVLDATPRTTIIEEAAVTPLVAEAPPPSYAGSGKQVKGRSAPGSSFNGPVAGQSHRIVYLGINESEDAVDDAHLLREVIRVLLEYPGKDRVNLEIFTGGRRVVMELPVVSTGYCEPLKERLEELLGQDTVMLQQETVPNIDDLPF